MKFKIYQRSNRHVKPCDKAKEDSIQIDNVTCRFYSIELNTLEELRDLAKICGYVIAMHTNTMFEGRNPVTNEIEYKWHTYPTLEIQDFVEDEEEEEE